jgi:parallel beta helix pectate lyase-like protein
VPKGRRAARCLAVLVPVFATVLLTGGGGAGAAPPCDKYASPLGLDISLGSELLPFRTPQRLADSLSPGQTGCLEGGTYAGGLSVGRGGAAGAPITIESKPGERALLIGRVAVEPGADHVTLLNLDMVGMNPEHLPSPMIEANFVTIAGSDITNLQSRGDCVFVGSTEHLVQRATINRNRIHNCGELPLQNHEQGISVWNASDTEIARNVIYDNADRGIQLWPHALRTHIAYNTIDGNGEGVLIAGSRFTATSDYNVVERNVVTNSVQRDNFEVYWPEGGTVGTGNIFRDNCVFGGARDNGDGGIMPRMDGAAASGNLVADPGYADRTMKDYSLGPDSPCLPTISGALWQPFRDDSIWNVAALQKGFVTSDNPYAGQFGSYSNQLEISGIPGSGSGIQYAKPIYFAKPGDPVADVQVGEPSWVKGDIRWDGKPIPVPDGVAPAPGSDGHLTIVSADRKTAWDMWRCTKADTSGYATVTISQWDLAGTGVPNVSNDNSSARGSGTPLIPTTIRAEEALNGINHALGITVPRVSGDYIYPPATHSDGGLGADGIKYGMLFVLRRDYPAPADAGIGERNIIAALKTYGAYVVDQGASMELDADSTQPNIWDQTGLNANSLDITPEDFRLINAGQ